MTESFVAYVEPASSNQRLRTNKQTIGGFDVHEQYIAISQQPLPSGAATEATLEAVRAAVDGLEGFTDGIETLLTTLGANTDQIEPLLGPLKTYTDGLEGLLTTINTTLGTPAQEHTTAALPEASRLTDGAAFYKALTDIQLRASAVPVSGPLTDAQLRATAIATVQAATNDRTLFDNYTPSGSTSIVPRYIGTAVQGTLTSAASWTINRFDWSHASDGDHVIDIQTLAGVAWGANTAARDALGWS